MCLAHPAIDRIKAEAKKRKVKVTIVVDFVHVLDTCGRGLVLS